MIPSFEPCGAVGRGEALGVQEMTASNCICSAFARQCDVSRVQVPNNHIPPRSLYYKYYFPDPTNLAYLDPEP